MDVHPSMQKVFEAQRAAEKEVNKILGLRKKGQYPAGMSDEEKYALTMAGPEDQQTYVTTLQNIGMLQAAAKRHVGQEFGIVTAGERVWRGDESRGEFGTSSHVERVIQLGRLTDIPRFYGQERKVTDGWKGSTARYTDTRAAFPTDRSRYLHLEFEDETLEDAAKPLDRTQSRMEAIERPGYIVLQPHYLPHLLGPKGSVMTREGLNSVLTLRAESTHGDLSLERVGSAILFGKELKEFKKAIASEWDWDHMQVRRMPQKKKPVRKRRVPRKARIRKRRKTS